MGLSGSGMVGIDWIDLAQVAGTCICGNETAISIKYGDFLDYARTGQLLKKDSVPWIK